AVGTAVDLAEVGDDDGAAVVVNAAAEGRRAVAARGAAGAARAVLPGGGGVRAVGAIQSVGALAAGGRAGDQSAVEGEGGAGRVVASAALRLRPRTAQRLHTDDGSVQEGKRTGVVNAAALGRGTGHGAPLENHAGEGDVEAAEDLEDAVQPLGIDHRLVV